MYGATLDDGGVEDFLLVGLGLGRTEKDEILVYGKFA